MKAMQRSELYATNVNEFVQHWLSLYTDFAKCHIMFLLVSSECIGNIDIEKTISVFRILIDKIRPNRRRYSALPHKNLE